MSCTTADRKSAIVVRDWEAICCQTRWTHMCYLFVDVVHTVKVVVP